MFRQIQNIEQNGAVHIIYAVISEMIHTNPSVQYLKKQLWEHKKQIFLKFLIIFNNVIYYVSINLSLHNHFSP